MKKILSKNVRYCWTVSLILTCMVFTPKSYSEESNLKINILNLNKPGVLYFIVCDNAAGFEGVTENESEEESCVTYSGEINPQDLEINIMLPHGEYAITFFVDSNGNFKMDKNFLGIPKEQYGFSNNVMGRMSAPSFDQAKFTITEPTLQNITLRIGIPR